VERKTLTQSINQLHLLGTGNSGCNLSCRHQILGGQMWEATAVFV